jgi:hypothetical protein
VYCIVSRCATFGRSLSWFQERCSSSSVLQRRLSENWLVQTQRAWINRPENEARKQLARARETIKGLFPDGNPKRDKSLAILDYQEVQAKASAKPEDIQKATRKLVEKKVIDENDKLFLELTGK